MARLGALCDSPGRLFEHLKQLVRDELDVLVTPLGGPVVARDQAHSMHPTEVPVHECVLGLGVLGGALGESQMPLGVLLPGVRLEERVLLLRARLDGAPVALENVLASFDQPVARVLPRAR